MPHPHKNLFFPFNKVENLNVGGYNCMQAFPICAGNTDSPLILGVINSSISHFSNDPRPALTGWNTQTGQASGDQKACLIKGLCIGLQDKEMSAF